MKKIIYYIAAIMLFAQVASACGMGWSGPLSADSGVRSGTTALPGSSSN